MEKTYQPQQIETKWYQHWEQQGYFKPSTSEDAESPYCIVIPPPNVTGSLHMGHGFQTTLMDTLIRLHRMRGQSTLWQVGTDHAGIATQMVVERQLEAQGLSRTELGRDDFLDKVWQWKGESGGRITEQLRRMGGSLDWSRERFTMDDGLSKAVIEVFVRLYEEDLIYKGTRLVNWDPSLHTAISDLEVVSEEEQGSLWHFRYPLADGAKTADGKTYLVVATTRPETMLGDTAVAVHPADERYASLIGQYVDLPLCKRRIPIIADDYVDQDFGTGCVKITPAHDFNDYDMGKRHNLPMINIFNQGAEINDNAPEQYQGLDRFKARQQIIADLDELTLVDKIEPHKLKVPRGEKTNVVVEPYLTEQWYVKTESLAKPAIEAVENGDIEFVPKNWENTYFSWMRDIQDWCISRQLWWGHRIPAWYDDNDKVYVGQDEATVRAKYKLDASVNLRQDNDVLDTWFSSALWSFSTLGWPEKTPELAKYHPTDVLVTGFDIIFFWVARMIMMSLKFCDEVPFRKVYITGLIRDEHGQKMSKSKGNVLDPIDLIDGIDIDTLVDKRTASLMLPKQKEKISKSTRKDYPEGFNAYGTDALRFTFCALASTGRDINFDINRLEGNRNFCNKIWNATNFVLMNTEDKDNNPSEIILSAVDRWILSRLQNTISAVNQGFDSYRFDLASQALYEFIWNEYCDWYVELAKVTLWDEDANEAQQRGTRYTLLNVLEQVLRLIHPIMPFISEEIWQKISPLLAKSNDSIMLEGYPEANPALEDEQAETDVQWLKDVIVAIRNIRGEMNIKPSHLLPVFLQNGSETDQQRLQRNEKDLIKIARLATITWLDTGEEAPQAATQLVGDMKVLVPLAGLIDVAAERSRLNKEIEKKQKDVERVGKKLGNASFVDKAPAAVVAKEQAKLSEASSALETLQQQLAGLEQLN